LATGSDSGAPEVDTELAFDGTVTISTAVAPLAVIPRAAHVPTAADVAVAVGFAVDPARIAEAPRAGTIVVVSGAIAAVAALCNDTSPVATAPATRGIAVAGSATALPAARADTGMTHDVADLVRSAVRISAAVPR